MTQTITVNSNNINLLFDSGANVSLVLNDIASKCRFDVKSNRTNDLSTACGGKFVLESEYKSDLGVGSISSKTTGNMGSSIHHLCLPQIFY